MTLLLTALSACAFLAAPPPTDDPTGPQEAPDEVVAVDTGEAEAPALTLDTGEDGEEDPQGGRGEAQARHP